MAGGMIGPGNGKKRYKPMAEINVTPLVDVMLVLLIIFMVTAPMITSSVNVNLPPANATPAPSDAKPITITVNGQGQVFLNTGSGDTQVELPNLGATLQQASQAHQDQTIFVRGDKSVDYGTMMSVMATITQSGFTKVHLVTDPGGH
jgi:biopolymer transport protein TolR